MRTHQQPYSIRQIVADPAAVVAVATFAFCGYCAYLIVTSPILVW